jgi:hypothetical protein
MRPDQRSSLPDYWDNANDKSGSFSMAAGSVRFATSDNLKLASYEEYGRNIGI